VRVLVAGAGLAGLSAARDLERDGASVTLIEARDRVGGRLWTVRAGFADGQHAEAGADIIEREQTPVVALARDLGLRLAPILAGGFAYYGPGADGRLAIQPVDATFGKVGSLLAPLVDAYRLAERNWDSTVARALGRESVADWLARRRAGREALERLRGLRGLFLADPEDLSLLALVDFLADGAAGAAGGASRVRGGNDQLATKLAASLHTPPHLGAVLRQVAQTRRRVSATIDGPSGRTTWRGDFVIAAMPASTLADVRFQPGLPAVQERAIRTLRYGPATRVMLQFDRRFWRRVGRARAFGSNRAHGAVWEGNEDQRGPGMLSLLAGGHASQEIQTMVARGGLQAVVRSLRWLGAPSRLLATRVVRWEDDPWARGGYAYFHPGFDPSWRVELGRPYGRVLFAGEHTSARWQGYLSGAVESGRRAAAELVVLAGGDWP
jgi:monoamine oxidase